jgi:hypothetical protein
MKDWFVKDVFLFTPSSSSMQQQQQTNVNALQNSEHTLHSCSRLAELRETGFGCRDIVRLRINGEFTFLHDALRQRRLPSSMATALKIKGTYKDAVYNEIIDTLGRIQCKRCTP